MNLKTFNRRFFYDKKVPRFNKYLSNCVHIIIQWILKCGRWHSFLWTTHIKKLKFHVFWDSLQVLKYSWKCIIWILLSMFAWWLNDLFAHGNLYINQLFITPVKLRDLFSGTCLALHFFVFKNRISLKSLGEEVLQFD